jgi:hypothetical protein
MPRKWTLTPFFPFFTPFFCLSFEISRRMVTALCAVTGAVGISLLAGCSYLESAEDQTPLPAPDPANPYYFAAPEWAEWARAHEPLSIVGHSDLSRHVQRAASELGMKAEVSNSLSPDILVGSNYHPKGKVFKRGDLEAPTLFADTPANSVTKTVIYGRVEGCKVFQHIRKKGMLVDFRYYWSREEILEPATLKRCLVAALQTHPIYY